jgi:beta-glucanase (GH16 family)
MTIRPLHHGRLSACLAALTLISLAAPGCKDKDSASPAPRLDPFSASVPYSGPLKADGSPKFPLGRVPKDAIKPGWLLTFHDEFDGRTLDETKWTVSDYPVTWNGELEYYTPEEVSIHKGCLRITSRKRDFKGRAYTSGHLTTSKKFTQLYGYFEVRAKLPVTRGMWPAHWLLPEGEWPPEIDIMEALGHEPNKVYMSNHWMADDKHLSQTQPFEGPDFTKGFHTFAVDWEPGKITWYVDGVARATSTEGVPHRPFYWILNTAVGGVWPKDPDATTKFPQYHDIDYVRVYKKDI